MKSLLLVQKCRTVCYYLVLQVFFNFHQIGCGKTLLAKALANETSVSLFYATGSEFDEMYVGIGAERVRKLFDEAKKNVKVIIMARLRRLFLLMK